MVGDWDKTYLPVQLKGVIGFLDGEGNTLTAIGFQPRQRFRCGKNCFIRAMYSSFVTGWGRLLVPSAFVPKSSSVSGIPQLWQNFIVLSIFIQGLLFIERNGFQEGRGGHILGVGAGDALGNGHSEAFEQGFPIRRHRAVGRQEVHRPGLEERLPVFPAIGVVNQFRAVMGIVVGQEGQVIGLSQEVAGAS